MGMEVTRRSGLSSRDTAGSWGLCHRRGLFGCCLERRDRSRLLSGVRVLPLRRGLSSTQGGQGLCAALATSLLATSA